MTVKPNDPSSGFFTFVHHDVPIEYSWDIQARINVILHEKPHNEHETRLRCITYVEERLLPPAFVRASLAYSKVVQASNRANRVKRWLCRTSRAVERAEPAYECALDCYWHALVPLALQLVPDAPWDGEELILPNRIKIPQISVFRKADGQTPSL